MVNAKAPVSALKTGHVPVDIDVFPMDNSGTKQEGVSRTYHGYDGYAPIATYVGTEGWCVGCELREGKQHSQKEFGYVWERILPRARRLTKLPLLVRQDSAHDALENRLRYLEEEVDFIIQWNPRGEDPAHWLERAERQGAWETPAPGKRVALFSVVEEHPHREHTPRSPGDAGDRAHHRQEGPGAVGTGAGDRWLVDLAGLSGRGDRRPVPGGDLQQFHSEFKTDLDIERLPSGKFDTNDLVLAFAVFAYNILRFIGLIGLTGEAAPLRHPAKRRRLKTVLQELMYLAARLAATGRRSCASAALCSRLEQLLYQLAFG